MHQDEGYKHDGDKQYNGGGQGGGDNSGKYVHQDNKYQHDDRPGGQYAGSLVGGGNYNPNSDKQYPYSGNYGGSNNNPGNNGNNNGGNGNQFGGNGNQFGSNGNQFAGNGNSFGGNPNRKPNKGSGNYGGSSSGNYGIGNKGGSGGSSNQAPHGLVGDKSYTSGPCSWDSVRNFKIIRQKGEMYPDGYHYL